VTQLASHSRTYNIFALVDALGTPVFTSAWRPWGPLGHGGASPKILAMLAGRCACSSGRRKELGQSGGAGQQPEGAPVQGEEPGAAGGPLQRGGPQGHLAMLHRVDLHLKTSTGNPDSGWSGP